MTENQKLAASILGYLPVEYVSVAMGWNANIGHFYEIYVAGEPIACVKV